MQVTYKSPQIRSLTGLRYIAAAAVVAHHFAHPNSSALKNLVAHSFLGVTLFFILSGFILSYTYLDAQPQMKGDKGKFWVARFARVYPVYLIGILVSAPLVLAWDNHSKLLKLISGISSIFLLQSWPPGHVLGQIWNPPGWSLSAEMFFYLCFPFICIPIARLSSKRLAVLMLSCWLIGSAATVGYIANGAIARAEWMFSPLRRLPEFSLGIAVAVLWSKNKSPRLLHVLAPFLTLASLILLIALMCSSLNEAYFFNAALSPIIALLIFSLAYDRGILARFLGSKIMVRLGSASYSLYILHWALWYEISAVFKRLHFIFTNDTLQFSLCFVVLTGLSCLCFIYIEEPINARIRNLHSAWRTRTDKRDRSQLNASSVRERTFRDEPATTGKEVSYRSDA